MIWACPQPALRRGSLARAWLARGCRGTAARAGVGTLVMTHYVPAPAPGQEEQWRALAAGEFGGRIELGDDLHRVEVNAQP